MEDKSPLVIGTSGRLQYADSDESYGPQRRLFGRPPSKTVHHGGERRPIFSEVKQGSHPQPQEKLRQIDKIVFNQDRVSFSFPLVNVNVSLCLEPFRSGMDRWRFHQV